MSIAREHQQLLVLVEPRATRLCGAAFDDAADAQHALCELHLRRHAQAAAARASCLRQELDVLVEAAAVGHLQCGHVRLNHAFNCVSDTAKHALCCFCFRA